MPICICGSESSEEARFCSGCGKQVNSTGGQEMLVLDLETGESSTSVVQRRGWDRRFWVPALVALAAVMVLVIWSTDRGTDSESAEQSDQDSSPPETTRQPPTTRAPTTTRSRETTSTGKPQAGQNSAQQIDTGFEGPFGYDLLVGTYGRPVRIDLDSGTATYSEGSDVSPVLLAGSWLVIEDGRGSGVARLPIDDLVADPEPLITAENVGSHVVSPRYQVVNNREIWILTADEFDSNSLTQTLYLVDVEANSTIEKRAADPTFWRIASTYHGLLTAPSGGVYEVTGDRYRLRTEGRVLAADGERALIETCDAALACVLTWLDRHTWQPLDLATPADPWAEHIAIAGTDWLQSTSYSDAGLAPTVELLNIETGQLIEVDNGTNTPGRYLDVLAVSPDGKWLATPGAVPKQIKFRNLESGETAVIELEERVEGRLFFIED